MEINPSGFSSNFSDPNHKFNSFLDKTSFNAEEKGVVRDINQIIGELGNPDDALTDTLELADSLIDSSSKALSNAAWDLRHSVENMLTNNNYHAEDIYKALSTFYNSL